MKRVLRILIPIVVITLVIGFVVVRITQTTASHQKMPKPATYPFDDARKLAEERLPSLSHLIGIDAAGSGLTNPDVSQRVTLGMPFIDYHFDLDAMAASATVQSDIRNQLDGGVNIDFPVLVDGKPNTILTIGYRNQNWAFVGLGGYSPAQLVALQERLETQGIMGRVDLLVFGPGWSMFAMVDDKGQTFLIPLEDSAKYFPELDFSGDQMYALSEVLPLVHVQAQRVVEDSDRQNRDMLSRMPTQGPTSISEPTATPEPTYPAPVLEPTVITAP